MLVSAYIRSFRTCRDLRLDGFADSPLVLLGRNGAGKTNILKAIVWASSYGVTGESETSDELGHVELRLDINGSEYLYNVERDRDLTLQGEDRVVTLVYRETLERLKSPSRDGLILFNRDKNSLVVAGDAQMSIPDDVGSIRAILSFYAGDSDLKGEVEAIANFLRGVRYYPLMPREQGNEPLIYSHRQYDEWRKSNRRSIKSDTDLNLLLINAWQENREKFDEIASLLGPEGLGVVGGMHVWRYVPDNNVNSEEDVEAAEQDAAPAKPMYGLFFNILNSRRTTLGYRLRHLSMGTRRVVELVANLVLDEISVALIEQPEDAIHPALLRSLMSIIETYSGEFQCVLTSHSPDVFNCADPESVRMVTIEGNKTSLHALSADQIKQARRYMEDDGTLAEFLETL